MVPLTILKKNPQNRRCWSVQNTITYCNGLQKYLECRISTNFEKTMHINNSIVILNKNNQKTNDAGEFKIQLNIATKSMISRWSSKIFPNITYPQIL